MCSITGTETKLTVAKDAGAISHNETPLKRIILDGITSISTDFEAMGAESAKIIRENSFTHVENAFPLRLRPSL